MSGNGDAIDKAIESADKVRMKVRMITIPLVLKPYDRPAVLQLPADIDPFELIGLTGWLLTMLPGYIVEHDPAAKARARLILPT